MKARFEIADVTLANASFRKARRWRRVLQGRVAQGRCTITEWVNVNRQTRSIEFEWPKEQHPWMRRFLGRFTRAWVADFGRTEDGGSVDG